MTVTISGNLKRGIKSATQRFLCIPTVNQATMAILRQPLIADRVSPSVLGRFPYVGAVRVEVDPESSFVLFADGSDSIANHLYWSRTFEWEADTRRVLRTLLPHAAVVVDIGANIGVYTLLASVTGGGRQPRQIFAFEPVPRICNALRRNIALNHLAQVVAERCAITDFDGSITLYIPADVMYPMGSSTRAGLRTAAEAIEVPAVRLDTYFLSGPGSKVERVDLMKIDTETTEPAVLAGGMELLRRDHPFVICEVLPGRTEAQLEPLLTELGYQFFWITDQGLEQRTHIAGDPTELHMNYLFAAPERMQSVTAACGCPRFEDCFNEQHL